MNIVDLINKKRENLELTKEELNYIIDSYMQGITKDYQISALLMAICLNGMSEEETFNLTEIMLNSGEIYNLDNVNGIKVDKHSTGGVGDKTTLVIAPLVASSGLVVPKMSGRGLGHTGGTIDKLESIEKFNVSLKREDFIKELNAIGLAITTTDMDMVPADKKLYALRDVTGTVSSIPLIASSIMSKKIATNADKIVLDVKVGDGALLKTKESAIELAKLMVKIGKHFNKETIAVITNMNYPIGSSVGNGLEVQEAIQTLKGAGDPDFRNLCITLASYMISLGKNIDFESAKAEVITNLDNGLAYQKFEQMVSYQNGNIKNIDISSKTINYKSTKEGYLNNIKTLKLGQYVMKLGAGRESIEDNIDYGVGIVLNKKIGDYIHIGDTIATIYVRGEDTSLKLLDDIFIIEEHQGEKEPLIYDVVK
ncbi:MAG TPA: thymidine phosphorylase [Mollicutes bacterium]|nr:thymidine phosphorylase [Mollicutes bacterium]